MSRSKNSTVMVMAPRQKPRKQNGTPRRRSAIVPQISSNVVKSHVFRFTATSAFNGNIRQEDVGGALGTIATVVNSTVTYINETFKVRRIRIWTPPASQGASATCSVNWIGGSFAANKEISDTSVSVSVPAHIDCKPPPQSSASFWQNVASSTALFTLACPSGSIVDLHVSYIEGDDESVNSAAVATAVLGHTYYLALDGPSTNLLVPVSLTTTH
jgi:hypothetical protein